jgi:hypothetical protein
MGCVNRLGLFENSASRVLGPGGRPQRDGGASHTPPAACGRAVLSGAARGSHGAYSNVQ